MERLLPVDILAFGEPTHGEPAFARARTEVFKCLLPHGFRTIAVEFDRAAALDINDYIQGGEPCDLHGFDDLVGWMREHRLTFHGFDAPIEMMYALSPVPYLRLLRDYLERDDDLADDERWADQRAQLDAACSIGRSAEAVRLRVLADDLLTELYAAAPTRREGWYRAYVNGVSALGLLRYHAVAADPAPAAVRTSRMLAVRDALMAQNLLDIRRLSDGPVLVAAHNRHLQRNPSRWHLAGMDLEWPSAGSIVSALLKDKYAVIVGSLGSSAALGLNPPAPETFEGGFPVGEGPLFDSAFGSRRADVTPDYFPLDAETVEAADAIWHVDLFSSSAVALADRIRAMPGVEYQQAGPENGAPELGWDDWFFFVGDERKHPFATIVGHDIPGFDEESRLDRNGVYRLNLDLGRDGFRRWFGYGPEEFKTRRSAIDFSAFDVLFPHPVYGTQGWASIVNPSNVGPLLEHAFQRSRSRRGA